MSRFAVVYEDPEYEDDVAWEDDEADWEDSYNEMQFTSRTIKDVVGEDEIYSPYNGA
jgi:hypothetical protein